jgi:hypothetical protein
MDKRINKPARENRGMNIPLGGYPICCASVSTRSSWVCNSCIISGDVSSGKYITTSIPVLALLIIPKSGSMYFSTSAANLFASTLSVRILQMEYVRWCFISIFLLYMNYNYRIFILLFIQIHNNIIYVKKLTTRFNFTNRRCCHA